MIKKRWFLIGIFLISILTVVHGEQPEWITRLPFTDDAFWGVGSGETLEIAIQNGKKDLLMQLSSQVEAVVSMEHRSDGGEEQVTEKLDAFIGSNTLRGASLESHYEENGRFWALMKYCDDCGEMLVGSALLRYEDELNSEVEEILERFDDKEAVQAVMVERRLHELDLADYSSEDITLVLDDKKIVMIIMNFLPNDTSLTPSQEDGLIKLSRGLLVELEQMDYTGVTITGHANPMGEENEEEELLQLSRNRAETMRDFFESVGILVLATDWMGGNVTIADGSTKKGRSRNRRVEITIDFE